MDIGLTPNYYQKNGYNYEKKIKYYFFYKRFVLNSLVILGSNSFIGRAFLNNLSSNVLVKAVAREIPKDIDKNAKGVKWIKVDTINTSSLIKIFSKDDIVINLIYVRDNNRNTNLSLMNNINEACIISKVSRLIHCSTASVVGEVQTQYINELTTCNPKTTYEKVKMDVEKIALNAMLRGVDVGILRPTAVVGYGGKNLQKLANSLIYGNKFTNYIKTCILGKMPMHLVPVYNVAEALFHLALFKEKLNGNVFIVSEDKDINNSFQKVEEILLDELGIEHGKFPYVFLPTILQSLLFKVMNRNDLNINQIYESKKIKEYGFKPIDTVKEAIHQFSQSIKKNDLVDKKVLTDDS